MHELHAAEAELIEPGPWQLDEPELSELPQPAVKPKTADDKKTSSAIFFIPQECRA